MRVIGHRGCPDHFPENTLAAVRGAAPRVDWIEIDVQRCASGEIVVFHDETLARLTGASGRLRDTTVEALSKLTIGDSDEGIPTLAAVLDALPAETGINVEVKHTGMAAEVAGMLEGVPQEALVSAFDPVALETIERIPTALLFADSFERNVEQAGELGCDAVHPHRGLVDGAAVEMAHSRGFAVNTWTIRSREQARRLRDAGVDGLIVDSWEVVE